MQDANQVYRDQVLTSLFLAFPQDGFIAESVLPTLNVPDLTGIAFKLDEQHLVAPGSSERSGLARANRVSFNLTDVSYGPLREHSLEIPITDAVMRLYKAPLVPETNATNVVTGQLLIEKEIAVRDQVTTTANYASGFYETLSGASQFSHASSALETKITAARKKVKLGCGHYPNKAIMNSDVRDALRRHPEVLARLEGAVAVTNEQRDAILRDILQVDEILIGTAVESDQPSGSTTAGTKTWIWGDDLVLEYVTPAPAIETLSLGYLLRLDPEHQTPGAPLIGVDKWYEQQIKSTFIRATDFYLPWTVANTAGYLFKDCLA